MDARADTERTGSPAQDPSEADELLGLFPPGTRQDADGMLVVGGCRLDDLAAGYDTPVMVVSEGAVRQRARDYQEELAARWPDSQVVFASKAFPCTAVQRLMVSERALARCCGRR